MEFTAEEAHRLAGRARTLHERLGDSPIPESSTHSNDVEEMFDEWQRLVAPHDEATFLERVRDVTGSMDECRRRLETNGWPTDEPLPDWIDTIEALLSHFDETEPDALEYPDSWDDSVPFAEVQYAIAAFARERADLRSELVSQEGEESIVSSLVYRVQQISAHSLFIEFKTYIAERDPELALADDPDEPAHPRNYYTSFIDWLFDGGIKSFFLEYSFLARLVATRIDQWVAFVGEICHTLNEDWDRLEETFAEGSRLGRVTDVRLSGDSHAGGKGTCIVEFSSGQKVVYKPRGLRVSRSFYSVVETLNDRIPGPEMRTVDFVLGDDYGWMEFIPFEPCTSSEAVRRYYERMGKLLAILYLYRFTDGHFENILSNGEHPVVIDLETVAKPVSPNESNTIPEHAYNVTSTALLPMDGEDNLEKLRKANVSGQEGLGSDQIVVENIELPEFVNVNTDIMDLHYKSSLEERSDNLPEYDGECQRPEDNVDSIVEGFEEVCQYVLERTDEFKRIVLDEPEFRDSEIRYVVRPTWRYTDRIANLQTPKYLWTGIEYGVNLESLVAPILYDANDALSDSVYESEIGSLYAMDVPRFATTTTSTDLFHRGEIVEESYFEKRSVEAIRDHIDGLTKNDVVKQTDYIRFAFGDLPSVENDSEFGGRERAVPSQTNGRSTEYSDRYVDHANRIFERIAEHATTTPEGDVTWEIASSRKGGIDLRAADDSIYEGRMGIALFVAALYRATRDDEHKRFLDDLLSSIEDRCRTTIEEKSELSFGLGTDLSSIYGFAAVGSILDDDRYVRVASDLADAITTEQIRSNDYSDVITGDAGLILSLASLYDVQGNETVVEKARIAGEHLLSKRVETDVGRTWEFHDEARPVAGFAHGIAGIAYAMSCLSHMTGDTTYVDAAIEGLEYEHRTYDPERENWVEQAVSDPRLKWCWGRPGIGLGRLGMASIVEDELVERDLERAISGVDPDTLMDVDHVCCGNFSRVEWFIELGKREDDRFFDDADGLASRCIQRARSNGRFSLYNRGRKIYQPSFFVGTAGIGYSMLRLHDEELPCVLLME